MSVGNLNIRILQRDKVYGILGASQIRKFVNTNWNHCRSLNTRWCPPSYVCWFIIPINYRYNPLINPSEIVLINQLNANELGHHLAGYVDLYIAIGPWGSMIYIIVSFIAMDNASSPELDVEHRW